MEKAFLILGMPASGKSTYIAAMSHILLSGEISAALRLSELDVNESHLHMLQDKWLRCQKLDHTPTAGENWVRLKMISVDEREIELELPDFSGESLRSAVVSGFYSNDLYDVLAKSRGLFVFTSADGKLDDVLINEVSDFLPTEVEGPPAPIKSTMAFEPMEMPEQAKLVQLLETVGDSGPSLRKIVVMISAWDVVDGDSSAQAPEEWLQNNRPMLWQYLRNNEEKWNVRVYGVSAQGGGLPAERERLSDIDVPSERVLLVGPDAPKHDLTAPLYWLTS